MEFFTDEGGRDNYRTALSNFFLLVGDEERAQRVFQNFSNHPLVFKEDVISIFALPKIIHDMTNSFYQGTVYTYRDWDAEKSGHKLYFRGLFEDLKKGYREYEGSFYPLSTFSVGQYPFLIIKTGMGGKIYPIVQEKKYQVSQGRKFNKRFSGNFRNIESIITIKNLGKLTDSQLALSDL